MTVRDNFRCYRNIMAIDPGYSFSNGTGYAIFDEQTLKLKTCGLIRPFAPGLESHASTIEIADKIKALWEEEVGFSYDPKILCIEHPLACFTKKGVRINSNSIITLAILCTRIEERFHAQTPLRPYPHIWKHNSTKEQTKNAVLDALDPWSLKALNGGLSTVMPHLRHNVFDAVGLGIWASKNHKISNHSEISRKALSR